MMNELYVLGELMEGAKTGYSLRSGMEVSLGRHRKISFGVVYPLLEKLEKNGFISLAETTDGKKTKQATITDLGREHFLALMHEAVPEGAHTEDIYQIKLDTMQHLPIAEQLQLIDDYIGEQEATIANAKTEIDRLSQHVHKDHWYAARKISLRQKQAEVAIAWAEDLRNELAHGDESTRYE